MKKMYTWTKDDFEAKLEGKGMVITRYKRRDGGNAVIPATIGGKSVTGIGKDAFPGYEGPASIEIPGSVTAIGEGAFSYNSNLKAILVSPENRQYQDRDGVLFTKDGRTLVLYPAGRGETAYTIPDSVTSIGDWAFHGCDSLKAIRVSPKNRQYQDRDGVLFTKDGKTLHSYPAGKTRAAYTIPSSVTSIGDAAFCGCTSLTVVTIPNSVTSIGVRAFEGCTGLTAVTIPDSVTSIGEWAFARCTSLATVAISSSITIIGNFISSGK
jgi:hypothetical protein